MGWEPDANLVEEIRDWQRTVVATYRTNPYLLEEHVRIEDNFEAGGYGDRQIPELLQNAIDQVEEGGRIELRIGDGNLYCANTGRPFTTDGFRAVASAFLSSKKEEQIGRFGLGFKSLLAVTRRPQIISRTVSFEFGGDEARTALVEALGDRGRFPLLRYPQLLDVEELRRADPNVAELSEWATTIIRVPLERGGERLREELEKETAEVLLFTPRLRELTITLPTAGGESETRSFSRTVDPDKPSIVTISDGRSKQGRWLIAERIVDVPHDVLQEMPESHRRPRVTVSCALPMDNQIRLGRFWSWFPLQDETTATAIFNAPWQVNEDRVTMRTVSRYNEALLEVAVDLYLEGLPRLASPGDPGSLLDKLPARGRESRSNADRLISDMVPVRACRMRIIPNAAGGLTVPKRLVLPVLRPVNGDSEGNIAWPQEAIEVWNACEPKESVPHASCFRTPTRIARLRQLALEVDRSWRATTTSPVAWLENLASQDQPGSTRNSIRIAEILKQKGDHLWQQVHMAAVVPLRYGRLARLSEMPKVLYPDPNFGDLIETDWMVADWIIGDNQCLQFLRMLGLRSTTPEDVSAAIASRASEKWTDVDWQTFWDQLKKVSQSTAEQRIQQIRSKGIAVKLPTAAGTWRTAHEVYVSSELSSEGDASLLDTTRVSEHFGRAAGVVDRPRENYPIHEEELFSLYLNDQAAELRHEYKEKQAAVLLDKYLGCGPLAPLALNQQDVDVRQVMLWTQGMLQLSWPATLTVPARIGPRTHNVEVESPEYWALRKFGRVQTSRGATPVQDAVAHGLSQYNALLPVVSESWISSVLHLPGRLDEVPVACVEEALLVRNAPIGPDALIEFLVHAAERRAGRGRILAFDPGDNKAHSTDPRRVVLAQPTDYVELSKHEYFVLPTTEHDDILIKHWTLSRAEDVLSRQIERVGASDPIPITDISPSLEPMLRQRNAMDFAVRRCDEILRHSLTPAGRRTDVLTSSVEGRTLFIRNDLGTLEVVARISDELGLGLTASDIERLLARDEQHRRNAFLDNVRNETSLAGKLLLLVGREALVRTLPEQLLPLIEAQMGPLSDEAVADLYLTTYDTDSLRQLRDELTERNIRPPREWVGNTETVQFVLSLGFPTDFAGTQTEKVSESELVPGKVELSPLHPYQVELQKQIRVIALGKDESGQARRALLFLPTGAGKTRVTVETILAMMRDGELASPVVWLAQSEELCEQALACFSEVWRVIGDTRPLHLSRYWGDYEVDPSKHELQVVIAVDQKMLNMVRRADHSYDWLRNASFVVIDEAHRGGAPLYTEILTWFGITQTGVPKTERPLLGLTATPFRGRNADINMRFANRFGKERLDAFPEQDAIAALRELNVLCEVDHELLTGVVIDDSPTMSSRSSSGTTDLSWNDVSKDILEQLGRNMDRTSTLVEHIAAQDRDWPILVFTPSINAAHVAAAWLRTKNVNAAAVDGRMRHQLRRQRINEFKNGEIQVLLNADLLTQGFDAPKVRALYIARPTFSPNRYIQMVGRGLRGLANGGTDRCLIVNVVDTFRNFKTELAYTEFEYLWNKGARSDIADIDAS